MKANDQMSYIIYLGAEKTHTFIVTCYMDRDDKEIKNS